MGQDRQSFTAAKSVLVQVRLQQCLMQRLHICNVYKWVFEASGLACRLCRYQRTHLPAAPARQTSACPF